MEPAGKARPPLSFSPKNFEHSEKPEQILSRKARDKLGKQGKKLVGEVNSPLHTI